MKKILKKLKITEPHVTVSNQKQLCGTMIRSSICFTLLALLLSGCSSGKGYGYVNTSSGSNTYKPAPNRYKPVKLTYPKYFVQKGDTLTSISRRSGLSVFNIRRFNHLKSDRLEIGQVLYLPGVYKMASERTVKEEKAVPTAAWRTVPSHTVSVIPRSRWAKLKIKGNIKAMGTVTKITVHHTDDSPSLKKISDVQFLKSMENHHRNIRKWACIGYHYIIGRDGKIYEGRPSKYQGAHARSSNPNNIGISLIGDFNKGLPGKAQLDSLKALLAKLRNKHNVPASKIYGHGHLGKTQCPGKHLKKWLEVYRSH